MKNQPEKIYFCFGADGQSKDFFDNIKDALAFQVINGGTIAVWDVNGWIMRKKKED